MILSQVNTEQPNSATAWQQQDESWGQNWVSRKYSASYHFVLAYLSFNVM